MVAILIGYNRLRPPLTSRPRPPPNFKVGGLHKLQLAPAFTFLIMASKTTKSAGSVSVEHQGTGIKVKAKGPSIVKEDGRSEEKSCVRPTVGGAMIGAGVGAVVGSVVPGVGTALGTAAGAAIGGGVGLASSQSNNPPPPQPAPKRCCLKRLCCFCCVSTDPEREHLITT